MENKELKCNEGLHVGCEVRILYPGWNTANGYSTGTMRRWDGPDCVVSDVRFHDLQGRFLRAHPDQRFPATSLAKIRDAADTPVSHAVDSLTRLELRSSDPLRQADIGGLRFTEDKGATLPMAEQVDYLNELARREPKDQAAEDAAETAAALNAFPARHMEDVNRVLRRQQGLIVELLGRVTGLEKAVATKIDAHNSRNEQVNLRVKSLHEKIENLEGRLTRDVADISTWILMEALKRDAIAPPEGQAATPQHGDLIEWTGTGRHFSQFRGMANDGMWLSYGEEMPFCITHDRIKGIYRKVG